jgi:uncharacterized protein YqgC (DUF456 family)
MPAVFLVLAGVIVLLRGLEIFSARTFWITAGILVILAGLQQLCSGLCKCCDKSGDGESCKK